MSDAQKAKMTMAAASKTRREYELHVQKLLAFADCPCVSIFASSGGPSTECSFTCEFTGHGILGYSPNCPTYGRKDGCKCMREMYKRRTNWKAMTALLDFQKGF